MAANLEYGDLVQLNNWIRKNADTWYFHCTTRTVQESKLFPVPPYMVLSYLQAYYRYPEMFRKLAAAITPEELGDRLREVNTKGNIINLSCIPEFYLAGRQTLIAFGCLKPTDGLEDLAFVEDFAYRLNNAYHRQNAHVLPSDGNLKAQVLPERTLQVFEADALPVTPGSRLSHSLQRFLGAANAYSFLAHCECRLGIHNNGPYKTGQGEMLVRGFADLGEGDLPWLDGVASRITHNNLTFALILKNTHFNIVDDWASFEATPSYDHDNTVAVGLYTSDFLSETYLPVAMDSPDTLADFLDSEAEIIAEATRNLWQNIAGWTRDQMIEAGALIYAGVAKDLFHIAGIYDEDDWWTIDERALRFRPLLNDEFGRDFLAELLGFISLPSQQGSSYTMSKWADAPGHMWSQVPYSVLTDDEWTATSGPLAGSDTTLPRKTAGWNTTRGTLSLDEYNKLAADFTPKSCTAPFRFLDDTWVKAHAGTPLADELYAIDQERSHKLKGRGSTVTAEEIAEIRAFAT